MDLRDHNIIHIIKSLSKEELKSLKNFLSSSFYNNLKKISDIFDILKKFGPDFNSENLNTEYIFKKLYSNKTYNHSTITNLISKIQKLLEEFLVVTNIQKNPFKKNEFLVREYFRRNLKSLSYKNIFNVSNEEVSNKEIDSDFFYMGFINDVFKINYIVNYGIGNQKQTVEILSGSLLKGNVNFINYFVMELMSNYLNSIITLSSRDTHNIKAKLDNIIHDLNIETLIKNIEPFNKYTYIVNLYLKLVQAFSDLEKIENYFTYKKELLKNKEKLNKDELYFHYSKMISYCSLRKDRNDNFDFQKEIFEICNIVLENEYYINSTSKFLFTNLYKIIVNSAIALKEFHWLKNFIHIYSKKVNPRLQKDAENFGLATLNFATGNYSECLTNLNNIRENTFILKFVQ